MGDNLIVMVDSRSYTDKTINVQKFYFNHNLTNYAFLYVHVLVKAVVGLQLRIYNNLQLDSSQ